eukprot:CAMPEP_0197072972 /NCGR_PEP_ID=MMETSP1384-20130603/210368_1 /TAXON_ID=29189 /ORGANISM="Ammonia sp." /LENGTH=663 /DNA_ID=CAMNT_0042511797 /DNA_START=31 /DNA_END=2023 /DNA_ORIENTATION=-
MASNAAVESGSTLQPSEDSESKSQLQRAQGLIPLTALGVGAVISGDFFGWNFGIERGGFGGLIIATLLVGFMYVCVSLSLAELAAMYPSAEGAFAFSRKAFGPYAGFCCGLSESLEYVLLVPVIITGLGDQLNVLFGIQNPHIQIVWWIVLCLLYLALHLSGAKPTFLSNTIITSLSVLTLVIYWCVCLSMVSGTDNDVINDRIYNIPPDPAYSDSGKFLPKGTYGIFTSLVFAAWFFIAVEELPLAGEDAIDPTKNIPRALIGSIAILMLTAFLTAFFSVAVPGGSFNISSAGAPLARALISGLDDKCVNFNDPSQSVTAQAVCEQNGPGYECEFSEDEGVCLDTVLSTKAQAWEVVINLGTLIGLMTSCHAIIFAGGRQLYSLTRNGTFPSFTRFDRVRNGAPQIALATDIVLSFVISLIVYFIGEGVDFLVGLSVAAACVSYILSMCSFIKLRVGEGVDFLVGLSVAAACVSYILSMCSFIKLRVAHQELVRPYKSPLGVVGAGYAAILSLLVGVSFFVDVGVGLGPVILTVVLVVFVLIYVLLSIEFLRGCGKDYKSGKQRFLEYEAKMQEEESNAEKKEMTQQSDGAQDEEGVPGGCGKDSKSGKQRFLEYEAKMQEEESNAEKKEMTQQSDGAQDEEEPKGDVEIETQTDEQKDFKD